MSGVELGNPIGDAVEKIIQLQQENAALRAEVAEKDKQLHCMELRAKSAEAIAGMPGVDITRPACDCCEHSGPTVQYHDAAGYLCDKCEPKVMSARESTKRHLEREAELEAEVARLTAEVERLTKDGDFHQKFAEKALARCCEQNSTIVDLRQQLAGTTERLAAAERIIGSNGMLRVGNVEIVDAQCDGKYEVENTETGDVIGEVQDDDDFEAALFDDWYSAYQAAIAQGWLPAGEAKGGGG